MHIPVKQASRIHEFLILGYKMVWTVPLGDFLVPDKVFRYLEMLGAYVFRELKLLISSKTKCDLFLYRLLTLWKSNKLTEVLPFFRPRTRVITSFLIYRPSSSSSYAFKNSRILHKPRSDGNFFFLIFNGVEYCPKTLWDYSEKKSPQKRINEQI